MASVSAGGEMTLRRKPGQFPLKLVIPVQQESPRPRKSRLRTKRACETLCGYWSIPAFVRFRVIE
jgi:hypothetical protein